MTLAWSVRDIAIPIAEEEVHIRVAERSGREPAVVYLHGLGSTWLDFEGAARHPRLQGRRLIAFDFPGCGGSGYPRHESLTVDDLVPVTQSVLQSLGARLPVAVVGHSMGGYVALQLAASAHPTIAALANIEGNLASGDCAVISRAASAEAALGDDADTVHATMIERLRSDPDEERRWYGDCLADQVTPRAFVDYCASLVEATDRTTLEETLCTLAIPRLFVYGEATRGLDYLPKLGGAGIQVAEVSASGHWPMHTNPTEFLHVVAAFCQDAVRSLPPAAAASPDGDDGGPGSHAER